MKVTYTDKVMIFERIKVLVVGLLLWPLFPFLLIAVVIGAEAYLGVKV